MKESEAASTAGGGQQLIISIENEGVRAQFELIPLEEIRLDPTNSRIRNAVSLRGGGTSISQEELCKLLMDEPGVSDLFQAIRDNGGLLEPIHVLPDGRVIEGNCRAACYLRLHKARPAEKLWRTIPSLRLPKITARQIAVLQGHFHVAGKNKWRAFEKAGHIHSMYVEIKMSPGEIAHSLRMQERVVSRILQAYEVMVEKLLPRMKAGKGLDKWSYIEEFFKNKELEDFRKEDANIDEFINLILDKKIKQGADVRKLPQILINPTAKKTLKKDGVEKAFKVVGKADPTADSPVFKRIKQLTDELNKLPTPDLDRLRKEEKPQELLQSLFGAIKQVAKLTKLRLT